MGRPSKAVEGFEWIGRSLIILDDQVSSSTKRRNVKDQPSSTFSLPNTHIMYKSQYPTLSSLKQASDLTAEGFLSASIASVACAEYALLEVKSKTLL
jgi:hypothetical protein